MNAIEYLRSLPKETPNLEEAKTAICVVMNHSPGTYTLIKEALVQTISAEEYMDLMANADDVFKAQRTVSYLESHNKEVLDLVKKALSEASDLPDFRVLYSPDSDEKL